MKGKILLIMGVALLLSACTKKETTTTTAAPPVLTTDKPAAQTSGNVIEVYGTPAAPKPAEPTTTIIPLPPPAPAPLEAAAPVVTTPKIPAEPPVQAPNTVEVRTGSTTEKVGVLECDNFISKYERCLGQKVPADDLKQFELGLDNYILQWQAMAKTPQGLTDVKNACRTMSDTTRQAMAVYGCAW